MADLSPWSAPFATQLPTLGATLGVGAQTGAAAPTRMTTPFGGGTGPFGGTPGARDTMGGGMATGGKPPVAPGMTPFAPPPHGPLQPPAAQKPTGQTWNPEQYYQGMGGKITPMTFPGVSQQGSYWTRFQDGSFVDYNSPAWAAASRFVPNDPVTQRLWQALPDSWKTDLARFEPTFTNTYLQYLARGDSADAEKVYQAAGKYEADIRTGNARQAQMELEALKQQFASNQGNAGYTLRPSPFLGVNQ